MRTDPERARGCCTAASRLGPRRGYYYQLAAAAGWSSLPFLRLIRQPTLIVAGDDDPIIPVVNAADHGAAASRTRELHLYHGGHLALLTEADELAPVIEKFLELSTVAPGGPDGRFRLLLNSTALLRTPDRALLGGSAPSWTTSSSRSSTSTGRARSSRTICPGLRDLGIMGTPYVGYDCSGQSFLLDGMISMELARGDASISTFRGVHSGLAMGSIYLCGSVNRSSGGCRRCRGWS